MALKESSIWAIRSTPSGCCSEPDSGNLSLYPPPPTELSDLIEGDPKSTTFTTGFYPMMTSVKLGVKIGF